MSYLPTGESYADYCSKLSENMPGSTPGGCAWTAGVCRPKHATALAAFKNVQSQLNRIADLKGWSKIGVDGDLGPGTVTLFNRAVPVMNTIMGYSHTPNWTCDDIALQATNMGGALRVTADRLKAQKPATVASSGSGGGGGGAGPMPPMAPGPGGGDLNSLLSSPLGLAGMAFAGFMIINNDKPARGKRKGKRRRARR